MSVLAASAVPAKRGQWRTISLSDGSTVSAQLVGDEYMHLMQAADGTRYVLDGQTGLYTRLDDTALSGMQQRATARRAKMAAGMRRTAARRTKDKSIFQGTKRAIVILANFSDMKFQTAHNLNYYKQSVNAVNFSDKDYKGSVRDYFRAQSNGTFDIDFDVVGPCQLPKSYSYYGKDSGGEGNDSHPGDMVATACQWAHDQGIDFSKYDWDGDGEVDQVFVLYAGKGQADGGDANTIWPHMYQLSLTDYGQALELDGVKIDTYACSAELNGDNYSSGIGTFCHEFSHCMGFPDFYDPSRYNAWFGMGSYDLMDSGSYSGNGFVPTGYTAYEKNECGWITLHDMTDISEATSISDMKPVSEYGDAYIIKNKGNNNEYYIVELRSRTGWDAALPDEGVMITHVDYDADVWEWNTPNMKDAYYSNGVRRVNDHQRMTIFHANNSEATAYNALYPLGSNNSLTSTSTPKASLYKANADGTRYMHVDIKDIAVADDYSSASLTLAPKASAPDPDPDPDPSDGELVFYESFDKCSSTGGNDGAWKGNSTATGTPDYDHIGWKSDNVKGADQCIKVGTGKVSGSITSPMFTVNGKATLSFKAGAWDGNNDGTTLNVTADDGTLGQTQFTMQKGAWTKFTTTVTANGTISLAFNAEKGRFFLDEVKVTKGSQTGISITATDGDGRHVAGYYTLGGVRLQTPQKGINIVRYADGTSRKVVVE